MQTKRLATFAIATAMLATACHRGSFSNDTKGELPVKNELPAAPGSSAQSPAQNNPVASADDAKETPIPAFVPTVSNPSVSSTLPCPAGSQVYRSSSSIFCAKPGSGFGKGRHGPALTFHANGKLAQEGTYKDGRAAGAFWTFSDEGHLESFIEYDGENEHGLRVTFHKGGKRATEGRCDQGKRVGVHKRWTETGELWTLTTYSAGKEVSTKTFNVELHTMTRAQVDTEMAKVKALQEEQQKMLQGMKK